jgi:hypothetical protein
MALYIVDNSGTVLPAYESYAVDGDLLPEDCSDSETAAAAREHGVCVSASLSLLDSISDALWGEGADRDWGADTLNAIADAIRTLRPDLAPEE